jgi:sulfoxide reductase catalytic subunit YedY
MKNLPPPPPSSEITSERLYLRRRELLRLGAGTLVGASILGRAVRALAAEPGKLAPIAGYKKDAITLAEPKTSFEDVTHYNNFYEFGTDKADPAKEAHTLRPSPWKVSFEGELKKPVVMDLDAILKVAPLEERVYRMRCVEAWSMVIPWIGLPLAALVKKLEPTSRAKYLAFETLNDPEQMPGQRRAVLDWPYVEGLRIDEAMNPLAFLAVGLYGSVLPNQNGAPLRLVVPWKYGFKGVKSIVKVRLQEAQPPTTWNRMAPGEYGFYANVNPEVDHPRWSQAKERRIGEWGRRKTLPFNGYAEQVASLYTGMDLAKQF